MTEDQEIDTASLRQDVLNTLQECHRDPALAGFRRALSHDVIKDLAGAIADRLAPRIGGRYIPKRADRAARDLAVWDAFNGRNHAQVMHDFNISRRLLYSILSRRPRQK